MCRPGMVSGVVGGARGYHSTGTNTPACHPPWSSHLAEALPHLRRSPYALFGALNYTSRFTDVKVLCPPARPFLACGSGVGGAHVAGRWS